VLSKEQIPCHFLYVFFPSYEEIRLNNEAANEEHFTAANSV